MAEPMTAFDLFGAGWVAVAVFTGSHAWRWEDPDGNEYATVEGAWNEIPPLPAPLPNIKAWRQPNAKD